MFGVKTAGWLKSYLIGMDVSWREDDGLDYWCSHAMRYNLVSFLHEKAR